MNRIRYPQVPQRVAQNTILLLFPVNFNFCRIKSATKFLCVKTSSGKVVATSLLYLTVHRIIANWQSTTRFSSSHRWTLCVTPKSPKGWLKTRIFTFGVAFHFFVAGHRRHLKFDMWVEHSKSQPTDDKPSLKWARPRHMTHFKFFVPLRYLWNGLS